MELEQAKKRAEVLSKRIAEMLDIKTRQERLNEVRRIGGQEALIGEIGEMEKIVAKQERLYEELKAEGKGEEANNE